MPWPPEKGASEELRKRREQAADVVDRFVGKSKGVFDWEEDTGFVFYHSDEPEVLAKVAKLPDTLFGFKLMSTTSTKPNVFDTKVAGTEPGEIKAAEHQLPLRPGTPIVSMLNGRLGPILCDAGGRLVSLTAAHLGPVERAQFMPVNDERGVGVGTFSPLDEADTAMDLVRIDISEDRGADAGYAGHPAITGLVGPHGLDSSEVYMERRTGAVAVGYVSATRAAIRFRRPGSESRMVVMNTVRVRAADPSSPFAVAGDSGAPVVDHKGRLLGIVLCADEAYTFVLPLAGIVERLGLSFLTGSRPAAIPPQLSTNELLPISEILSLYASANRRDVLRDHVDLGDPPPEIEVPEDDLEEFA